MTGSPMASQYGNERYVLDAARSTYHDKRLGRDIFIHCVTQPHQYEIVHKRLAKLQAVRSPYVALVYDIFASNSSLGVVEEAMPASITYTPENRLLHLYEFCAGLAALHECGLAHGKLNEYCFGQGALGRGRLCNLAFVGDGLDNPETDRPGLILRLSEMEAFDVQDAIWQMHWRNVVTGQQPLDVGALRNRLNALLLQNRHRALVHWRGTSVELSAGRRSVTLKHPNLGISATVKIEYDGTRFLVAELAGEVRVNNQAFSVGQELPQSCVIVLGHASRPWTERYSITFDQSHPEVI